MILTHRTHCHRNVRERRRESVRLDAHMPSTWRQVFDAKLAFGVGDGAPCLRASGEFDLNGRSGNARFGRVLHDPAKASPRALS